MQIQQLQRDVDDLKSKMRLILWIGAIVLAGGATIGFVTAVRTERRATQLHELAVAGETGSQGRAEEVHSTFLDASQQTLTLVNDTLRLAKDASERATDSLEVRARRSHDQIDMRGQEVLAPVLFGANFKSIVEDPGERRALIEVAKDLLSIEGYIEMHGVPLSPTCLFIKGMYEHLEGEPHATLRTLRLAAQHAQDRYLSSLTLFWLGYVSNNLGNYPQAIETFTRARDAEGDGTVRRFELARIRLESRFFDLAHIQIEHEHADPASASPRVGQIEGLEGDFSALIASCPATSDFDETRVGIYQTWANLLTWASRRVLGKPQTDLSSEQRELLERALDYFKKGNSLWARFGQADTRFALAGEVSDGDLPLWQEVVTEAIAKTSVREEVRSRASLHQTKLIAEVRLGTHAKSDPAKTYQDLRTVFSSLDHDVTVYSQYQKCNVASKDFDNEVQQFWRDHEGDASREA